MNAVISQDLFRYRHAASRGLNNLCTVIHKLTREGVYAGEVGRGDRVIGTFQLRSDAQEKATQVNIDLSTFDEVFRVNARHPHVTDLVVGKDGFAVFSVTGPHQDIWVALTRVDKDNRAAEFDSRKLSGGDFLVLRLWYPGTYVLTNQIGGTTASLSVIAGEAAVARKLSRLDPRNVTLSARGFEPRQIDVTSAQALVVRIDTPAAVTLESLELEKAPPASQRGTRQP